MAAVCSATGMEWMHDIDAAARKAAAEDKLLLVEFTGSDWCRFCKLQKDKVLSSQEFTTWAEQHCVPVEIDIPHDATRVGGEQQKRLNTRLCNEYEIKNFPTLKLLSPEMVVVGGYKGALGSPKAAIAKLKKGFPTAEKLKKALSLKSADQLQALTRLYTNECKGDFHLLKIIAQADQQNSTGLVPQYLQEAQIRQLHRQLDAAMTADERLHCIDQVLPQAQPANLAMIREMKGNAIREKAFQQARTASTLDDVAQAHALMQQSLEYTANASSRAQLEQYIRFYFADHQAILERARKASH